MTTTTPLSEATTQSLIRAFNLSYGGISPRKSDRENARIWASCERFMEELDRRAAKYRVANGRMSATV